MMIKKMYGSLTTVILAGIIGFSIVSCQNIAERATSTVEKATASNPTSSLTVDVFVGKDNLVTSTLIAGKNDAILVDGQEFLSDGKRVADWIKQSGKKLTAIWISHGHPDHYFGTKAIVEQFPGTQVYTTAEVVEAIRQKAPGSVNKLRAKHGDDVPSNPVIPEVFSQDYLELEGQRIEIVQFTQGDTEHTTLLHIPTLNTVITGDLVYNRVHPWLVETKAQDRQEWVDNLNKIKAMNPKQVFAGHKVPELDNSPAVLDAFQKYIETFSRIVETEETAEGAIAAMQKAYPDYQIAFLLKLSVQAAYRGR